MKVVYPKYPCPLLDIDHLINGSLVYHMLSFMDSYSGYNQIQMDSPDASKISFMWNHDNYYYYYHALPFDLKNIGSTYQWLMNVVFSHQINQNLKVYIDDNSTSGYNRPTI